MKRIKKYILKLLNIVCYRLYRISGKRESILEKVDEELIFRSWTKNNSHCYIQSRDEWSNHPELDLSIIVPLYNSEQFIHRNVDSLLAQKTYFKYEIILVNDGSKDSTQRIVEKYRDENPEKIVEQAIKKMITRNPLGRKVMKKLFIYAGSENPHMAQKPEFLDIASMNIKNKKRK